MGSPSGGAGRPSRWARTKEGRRAAKRSRGATLETGTKGVPMATRAERFRAEAERTGPKSGGRR